MKIEYLRMDTLRDCFAAHQGRLIDKWSHYFPIYEHHFAKFVGRKITVLEIGVAHGGSLQLWKTYFGENALIVGVDIDPRCKEYEEDRIQIEIGNQADGAFWEGLRDHYIGFDIVIDDGSHQSADQSASFRALWPQVREGGIYLIEDCHGVYPGLQYATPALRYEYPWVLVLEKPKRMVIGTPSRPLNEAERAAYG